MNPHSDRRWAQLARELEFTQLPELRRQAEGWRTGLTGLTALFAILVLLKGRDDLSQLPAMARLGVGALLGLAFLLLLLGSVLAVRAAHGMPGDRVLLAGQALRDWTTREIVRVSRALRMAALCCLSGVTLVGGAVAVVWLAAEPPADHLVQVVTTTDNQCGELLASGSGGLVLKTAPGERTVLPPGTVTSLTPVPNCGSGD
ncbi:hypothetical protein ABZX97_07835 [Streptomyces seoulensis]|uniref:hypothetical protein n=1 Tax=Streptomyces seoulensis TaxID=73044 RepID=UPI0033B35D2C